MSRPLDPHAAVVLVGGHESCDGSDLSFAADSLPGTIITPAGRPLHNVLTRLIEHGGTSESSPTSSPAPLVVVPMTFGRNPTLVADTAKTLKWLRGTGSTARPLVLADPFGTADHLTAWLRTAATEVRRRSPQASILIVADAANPFDDAELFRISHLVRTHGAGNQVETAVVDGTGALLDAVRRLRLLGSTRTVVVPAGFRRAANLKGEPLPFGEGRFANVEFYGPLLSEQAVLRVIHERIRGALHALGHGRTGIDAGLQADHGHGYAHSHAFDEAMGHTHTHSHGAVEGHTHNHPTPIRSS